MRKHFIITVLLASMMLSALASCGQTETAPETTADTTITETEPETTEREARQAITDDLPERDFAGKDYTVLADAQFASFIDVEELTGEALNDSVYNRNLTIEERYNTNIRYDAPGIWSGVPSTIQKSVNAGDADAFQIASYHVVANSANVLLGYYMNWYNVPYVNFEKPWWSDSTVNDLTVNNCCYLAVGDMAVSSIAQTYCMIFDKERILDYEIANVYDTVREGKWTIDYLQSIAADIGQDLNGDGVMNREDFFGFLSNPFSNLNTYLWAFDNQIYQKDSNGEMVFNYYSERLVNIFEKLHTVFYTSDGIGLTSLQDEDDVNHYLAINRFANGGCLFVNANLSNTMTRLADFENEYGILPYPKFDEAQKSYKTMVDGSHEAMGIAKNGNDLEFVGIITEVMCAEAYKQILPTYYDVCLKQRYASSPDDAEMIELCVNSRVFDFGYVYDNWKGVAFFVQDLIGAQQSTDITSHYKSKETAALNHYNSVLALFTEDAE